MLYPAELQSLLIRYYTVTEQGGFAFQSQTSCFFLPGRLRAPGASMRRIFLARLSPWIFTGALRFESPKRSVIFTLPPKQGLIRYYTVRSRGDSNPRYPFGVQLLSREPDSTALAPLQGISQEGLNPLPHYTLVYCITVFLSIFFPMSDSLSSHKHPVCSLAYFRSKGDSNPRNLAAQRFSRPPPSTTRTSLHL